MKFEFAVRYYFFLLLLIVCFSFGKIPVSEAQTTPVYNRFQYHNQQWKVIHTSLFHLYFPKGYDSLASLASVQLPDIIDEVKRSLGTEVKSIPNLIIYPSLDQLYESNIGRNRTEVQTFPTINIKGSRVMLAFDGSFEHLKTQLKISWLRLSWEEQFKNDVEEQLTGKKALVPYWFTEGAINYFANGWRIANEASLQQWLEQHAVGDWKVLVENEPVLAGSGFCYFLTQKYRPDVMKQLVFQMRQGKTLSRALKLITKQRLDSLNKQCIQYFRSRIRFQTNMEEARREDTMRPWIEMTYKGKLVAWEYSKDSIALVFVIERGNNRQVYVVKSADLSNTQYNAKFRPFTHYLMPPWLSNYTHDLYPLICWNEKGGQFSLTMPEKGKLQQSFYNEHGAAGRVNILYGIDGIQSIAQWNESQWLLSAYRRGRSDIVGYNANNSRYTPLTTDNADHTELFLSRKEGSIISYRSGYPFDSLYHKDTLLKNYGVYLKNCNNDFKQSERKEEVLVAKDSAYVSWHQQKSGTGDFVLRNLTTGYVVSQSVLLSSLPVRNLNSEVVQSPWLMDYLRNLKIKDSIDALLANADKGESSFLKNVLTTGDTKKAAQMQRDSIRRSVAYSGKKVSPYLLQLYSAYFSAQVNNDYFINRFQPYQSYLGSFKFPEVGAMLSSGFSDLFENHHFNIGYRMPAGTEGSDFFVRYENTAKKTDWHLLYFRKMESLEPDGNRDWKDSQGNPYPAAAKVKTHYYELGFHTPLHYDWSLDYSLAARNDKTIFLATDKYSLNYEALKSWWGIANVVAKVHKLHPTIPLLEKGWEGKLLLDGMASTGKQSTMVMGVQMNLSYSQPLWKDITLVTRAQAGYSAGQSKILYNFGGLDNNVVTRVDTSVHFKQDAPYAFQTIVTPFRGYEQNSIYGSSYGLLNVDLYFPLFRTLIPLHTSFTSFNNLQLGLFTDIATTGGNDVMLAGKSNLHSFGYSIRTMLAGYPIRFDMAWPGTFNKAPVWYLSLTLK